MKTTVTLNLDIEVELNGGDFSVDEAGQVARSKLRACLDFLKYPHKFKEVVDVIEKR